MKVTQQSKSALAAASALLKKGGVIIVPTDTVYGFLADATNKKAVEKIYKIKNMQPKNMPLQVNNMYRFRSCLFMFIAFAIFRRRPRQNLL